MICQAIDDSCISLEDIDHEFQLYYGSCSICHDKCVNVFMLILKVVYDYEPNSMGACKMQYKEIALNPLMYLGYVLARSISQTYCSIMSYL